MPTNNPLPQKENALFKRILKCYEQKQYKNGLKFAKQILSNPKFAEHGETLAMKGLTLNCMGKKDEAFDHVRRGLRNDLKSHVCWHVYGLLQRSEKKYDEAIKCYRNALKWDKDNLQILRDLSLLQIQMRDLDGYKETRYQLLVLRPTQRASWIGYAMAHHLLKEYTTSLKILEEFRKTQTPKYHDYEYCELILYQVMVLQESGMVQTALTYLETYEKHICDTHSAQEIKAHLLLSTNNHSDAEDVYRNLLSRNPECWAYYKGLEASLDLDEASRLALYQELSKLYPKSDSAMRLPMNFAGGSGKAFEKLADQYLRKGLHKGVPPLFTNLRALYVDKDKSSTIENLVVGYHSCLNKCSRFSEDDLKAVEEPPTVLLWVMYFLAQHYDYLGQTKLSLDFIEKSIEHTPTLIELFVAKARIYKHAGDVYTAVKCLDEAQSLDTADRYVNSKCAKYMLRAGMVKEAEEMCTKFTREGVPASENLNEMQCMWFQTECALCWQRCSKPGEALKKCHEIERHFVEIVEDQFDFHTYCMRKMTLRAYVQLLRLEDKLHGHQFYFKTARCAIQIYLSLFDKPLNDDEVSGDSSTANLTPAELKKLKNKQRKAKKKAEQQKQAGDNIDKKEGPGGGGHHHNKVKAQDSFLDNPKEEELLADKLARTENPLDEAIKFLIPLQDLSADEIETHLLAFDIYYRKGKLLLMLQSVKRSFNINADNDELHICLVKFYAKAMEQRASLHGAVANVLDQTMEEMYRGMSADELNKHFLKKHENSLLHRLAGARMMYHLDQSKSSEAIAIATSLEMKLEGVTLKNCVKVLESLRHCHLGPVEDSTIIAYQNSCHQHFPLATAFSPNNSASPVIVANHNDVEEEDEEQLTCA